MELVFIHGWAFDPAFWDSLAVQLSGYKQTRIDLGFFKDQSLPIAESLKTVPNENRILIGHSLGFLAGMKYAQWDGWVAINSFTRFVKSGDKAGCVAAPVLRDMRMRLAADAQKTVKNFHDLIDASLAPSSLNAERLREGLDLLRDGEVDLAAARTVPGLVLAGAKDPLVPVEAGLPLAAIAAESELYEKCGHLIPQSDPACCAEDIADFISRNFESTRCLSHA